MLVESGLGYSEGSRLFSDPDLASAVFGWDSFAEVEWLESHFHEVKDRQGLDVGCGYGRLLLPLVHRGYTLDGIDSNLASIAHLSRKLTRHAQSRAIRADISSYCVPRHYSFAYAAMNTVRYLETKWALRRHFQSVHQSLESGGIYLLSVSLTPEPWTSQSIEWAAQWHGTDLRVTWSRVSYCYVMDQIIDQVEIVDSQTGQIVLREYQTQANVTWPLIEDLVSTTQCRFSVEATYSSAFALLKEDRARRGTVWVKLRKRD
jgi:SAM-dependent methyltransferase